MEKLITSKDKILSYMETYPELRANKYRLASNILYNGLPKELQTSQVEELLQIISVGHPIPLETIFREYRDAFHMNPLWKDEAFYLRQADAEVWRKTFIERVYGKQTNLFND